MRIFRFKNGLPSWGLWFAENYIPVSTVCSFSEAILVYAGNTPNLYLFIASFFLYVICVIFLRVAEVSKQGYMEDQNKLKQRIEELSEDKAALIEAAKEVISEKLQEIVNSFKLEANDLVTLYLLDGDYFYVHTRRNTRSLGAQSGSSHHKSKGVLGALYSSNKNWIYAELPSNYEEYTRVCIEEYNMTREDAENLTRRYIVYYGYLIYNHLRQKAGVLFIESAKKVAKNKQNNYCDKLSEYAKQIETVFIKFRECQDVLKVLDCKELQSESDNV